MNFLSWKCKELVAISDVNCMRALIFFYLFPLSLLMSNINVSMPKQRKMLKRDEKNRDIMFQREGYSNTSVHTVLKRVNALNKTLLKIFFCVLRIFRFYAIRKRMENMKRKNLSLITNVSNPL